MARVIWLNVALDDLDGIIGYIEQFNVDAGADLRLRLYALGESLAQFPRRGRPMTGDVREMTNVPPYVLRYRVEGDVVEILSIRHGRRRPGAAPADPA